MAKFLVDILALNQMLNFQFILTCLFVYLLIIWGSVCTWVYFDAKKRYESRYLCYGIALAIFIFSFPALILYLVIRKEEDESHGLEIENLHVPAIPIADLTQDGEIKFKLEMSIIPVGNPVNKTEEKTVMAEKKEENKAQVQDTIKVKLVQYMNEKANTTSELDKRIKRHVSKLLKLIKTREKQAA